MLYRLIIILFFLVGVFTCESIPSSKNSNLGFISYIARLSSSISNAVTSESAPALPQTPTSTAIPKVVSTDFTSNNTLSPVVISKTQTLLVTLDTPMSAVGCNIKVNGGVVAGTTTVSTDKLSLSFKPSSSWGVNIVAGLNLDLSSDCKSEGGVSYVPEKGVTVYIADSLVYVDSIAGNDNNSGTSQNPKKTLQASIASILSLCSGTDACVIAVKGGTYSISVPILISSNVSLFGGFDPSDWTKRRADKTSLPPYDTIVTDTSTNVTGTGPDPYSSVKFFNHAGTKEKSILDGIIVNGPVSANAGSYVSPIGVVNLQSGSGVTIRNTVTNDLSSTLSVTSVGFVSSNNAGTIDLTNNKFNASLVAGASSTTHGIVYNGSTGTSAISILNCDIDAGISTTNSSGFFPTNTINGIVTLSKNTITARNCPGCDSIGIIASFATANGMTISENTINTGSGINSFGINYTSGNGLLVDKNSITTAAGTTSSKGITTGASASNPTISNNTIISGSGGTNGSQAIVFFNSTGTHTISGNNLTSGLCNAANCVSAGLQIIGSTTTVATNNIMTGGLCTGVTCSSAGIHLSGSGTTHTFTGNTITSSLCNTSACISTGIFDNAQATLTFNNNTISSGTCSGLNCDTRGYYLSHAFNTMSNTVTFSNNSITSGNCTGTSCKAFGISATNSMGASITYNFSGNTISSGDATLQASGINIAFNNSTLTLTNNTISSGSAPTTWGINNAFSAGTTYTGNTVSVGSCTGSCPQIAIRHAANSGLTMTGNTVNSGVAGASNASRTALSLENWSGGASSVQRNSFLNESGVGTPIAVDIPTPNSNQLKFCSNVLFGGGRTNAGNAITLRMAQMNAGAGTKFNGNTIIGASVGSGTVFSVNFITNAGYTNFSLDQNIIAGNPVSSASTTCIKENAASTYQTLAANNLSNCNTLYDENGIIRNNFCSGNFGNGCGAVLANPTGLNNTILSPVFVNFAGNDFHLDPATPTGISQGMTSGDLSVFSTACGNSLDRDGNTRVANSAIGAYK
ncbi:MAG TPA: hypothetical protein PLX69_06840 [Leptospiraceae bacterium]|nr:hypothetical protein [Leptospiraceae bacterium]